MKTFTLCVISLWASTLSFGQGNFLKFNLSIDGRDVGTISYYYQDNNCRSEIHITDTLFGETKIVTVIPSGSKSFIYQVDEVKKQYTKIDISNSEEWKDYPVEAYKVTVLETTDTVNGYNTRHVRIDSKDSTYVEFWTTTDIADYNNLLSMRTSFTGKPNAYKALRAAGAYGFPVRISFADKGEIVRLDLIQLEKQYISPTVFLTSGYKLFATVEDKDPIEVHRMMNNPSQEE